MADKEVVMKVLTMALIILVGLTQGLSAACPGNHGDILGSFQGITAYSNGSDVLCYDGSSTYGYKWQCVEFVKRFYGDEVGDPISASWGSAANAYDDGEPGHLNKYANGGSMAPEVGDILCFDDGGYGHVGIVTKVNHDEIKIIDQNRTTSSSNILLPRSMTDTDDDYTVSNWGNYDVEGWLRDPDYKPDYAYSATYIAEGTTVHEIYLQPDQDFTITINFRNDGKSFWSDDGNISHYIELQSVAENWTDGYANNPLLSPARVKLAETGGVVDSNSTVAISFSIHTPTTPGSNSIRVRLYHPHSESFISGTGSDMTFTIQVIYPPSTSTDFIAFTGKFNGDNLTDIGLYDQVSGGWFVALNNSSAFVPSSYAWLANWGASTTAFIPLIADFNRDGKTDICLYEKALGRWYVALNQGNSTFAQSGTYWLDNWGASSTAFTPLTGDFNGDGYSDVCLYQMATGGWFIALGNGTSFTPSSYAWLSGWGASTTAFIPLASDYNGDGKTDICLYEKALGRWYVALNQGNSTFAQAGNYWLDNWGASSTAFTPLTSWFNGDGLADVMLYEKSLGRWYVGPNNGNNTFTAGGYWIDNWGASSTAFTPLLGDFNTDSRTDICLYEKSLGRWYVAMNQTNNTFSQSGTYWLDGWGVETGGGGKITTPENQEVKNLPIDFTLSQNYPNPFNPVTTISYSLPGATQVTLDIFNILGQKVVTLVNERQEAGNHSISWDAKKNASGIYFYRLVTGEAVETKKMVLLK